METVRLSPANLAYVNAQKTLKAPEEIKISPPREVKNTDTFQNGANTLKSSKNKRAFFITTAIFAGALVYNVALLIKQYNAQKLSKFINFEPAKTLDEAKQFAKKFLKVDSFELKDLNAANYVNEALVHFNNNISKDHKKLIDKISSVDIDKVAAQVVVTEGEPFATLQFNEKMFKDEPHLDLAISNLGHNFKTLLSADVSDRFNIDKSASTLVSKWANNDTRGKMTLKEKWELYHFLNRFENLRYTGKVYGLFENLLSDPRTKEILKSENLPSSMNEFAKLDFSEQKQICDDLMKKHSIKITVPNVGPYGTINHELGHLLHKQNVGSERFYSMRYGGGNNSDADIARAKARFIDETGALALGIEKNVSSYALTDPVEFVAETFAYLCNGVKFSPDIMKLYEKFGGVIPKGTK